TLGVMLFQASSRAELLLGIGAAAVTCLLLVCFGVLSRRVHLAWCRGALPWQARHRELLALGIGVVLLGVGLGCVTTLDLTPAGMLVGALLALSMGTATMCLGVCASLSRIA